MKRMLAFLLVIILAVSIVLTGCSSSDSKLSFSAYYKNAKAFDEFEPLIQQAYIMVFDAYNKCKKNDPKSFNYDEEAFDNLNRQITNLMGDTVGSVSTKDMEEPGFDPIPYYATSDANYIYANLYAVIHRLIIDIADDRTPEDWYTQIGDVLEQTRVAYAEDK